MFALRPGSDVVFPGCCAVIGKQVLHHRHDVAGRQSGKYGHLRLTILVEDIQAVTVIQRIRALSCHLGFCALNPVMIRDCIKSCLCAGQADESRVEIAEIGRDDLWRVPLRIHRYKDRANALSVAFQALHCSAGAAHLHRANMRTVSKAKYQQHHVAAQGGQSEILAMVIDQCDISCVLAQRERGQQQTAEN